MRAHQRGIGTARQHHKTQRQMISQSTHEGPDRSATKTRTIRTLTIPLKIRRAVVRRISTAFLPRMLTPSRAGGSSLAQNAAEHPYAWRMGVALVDSAL